MACVPPELAESVLAELHPELRSAIESAGILGWIPLECHVALIRGWHAGLGDEALRQLFRRAFLQAVDTPLFGAIISGSLRVFGRTPSAAARAWVVGWPYLFRNGGVVEIVEASEGKAAIKVIDLPASLRDDSFALGVAGSFDGNAEVIGKTGRAEYDCSQLSEGVLHLSLSWG